MIRRATPLAFALATLLGWALFLSVFADRAELLIAAVPLAVALLALGRDRAAPRFELRRNCRPTAGPRATWLLVTVMLGDRPASGDRDPG